MGFIGTRIGARKLGYNITAVPPGGKDLAHQIVNTGTEELRYLAVSTKESPELVDYPDSGKFGKFGILAERPGTGERFAFIGRADQSLDYWEGN